MFNIIISTCTQQKTIISEVCIPFLFLLNLQNQYLFYTYSISLFGLDAFQIINSHTGWWLPCWAGQLQTVNKHLLTDGSYNLLSVDVQVVPHLVPLRSLLSSLCTHPWLLSALLPTAIPPSCRGLPWDTGVPSLVQLPDNRRPIEPTNVQCGMMDAKFFCLHAKHSEV